MAVDGVAAVVAVVGLAIVLVIAWAFEWSLPLLRDLLDLLALLAAIKAMTRCGVQLPPPLRWHMRGIEDDSPCTHHPCIHPQSSSPNHSSRSSCPGVCAMASLGA